MNHTDFEQAFHSRTVGYQPGFRLDQRPVVIELAPGSETPSGQHLASCLTNLLARAHPRLVFVGELEGDYLPRSPFGYETLIEATAGQAQEINPSISVDVVQKIPAGDVLTSLSIGPGRGELSLGTDGWLASFGSEARIVDRPASRWGAALAACFGAWFAFQRLLDAPVRLGGTYSLWDACRPTCVQGPLTDDALDVGRVLQVGAGGVGAALDYWLATAPLSGAWTIVDGDDVEPSNLNRQLAFLATDAGWEAPVAKKAPVAASRLGPSVRANDKWWGKDPDLVAERFDVILALANERGVREALQDRQPPLLLHATTSPNYQAQLHRHVSGRDDCIRCRLPGGAPVLACSEVELPDGQTDAALPFLSGLAGLLLAVALARLASGDLADDNTNLISVDLGGNQPQTQTLTWTCREGCRSWGPRTVREQLAAGTRWASLVT